MQARHINPQARLPGKSISWRGVVAILFTLSIMSYSYSVVTETNVPASQTEIDRLVNAAKADKRAQVAAQLQAELRNHPNPKIWQLHRIKYKLGLSYVDSQDYQEQAELQAIEKNLKH